MTTEERDQPVYRTRSGKVLTESDIQELADEAERGYDLELLLPRHDTILRPIRMTRVIFDRMTDSEVREWAERFVGDADVERARIAALGSH